MRFKRLVHNGQLPPLRHAEFTPGQAAEVCRILQRQSKVIAQYTQQLNYHITHEAVRVRKH